LILGLWKRLSSTMVLVTHNIEEAVFWGEKIMILGHPPITRPVFIENRNSGSPDYRHTADFISRCQQLRRLVEQKGWNGNNGWGGPQEAKRE